MNRAFIFILIPAALVGVLHAGMRWGFRVALPMGLVLAVVVAAAYWRMSRPSRT